MREIPSQAFSACRKENMTSKSKKIDPNKPQFVPRSEKQRLILTDLTTDVLLCGGK